MTLLFFAQFAAAAPELILVICRPESRAVAEKIAEELSLNALEVELREGRRNDAQRARTQPRFSAVVFVESGGATIFTAGSGPPSPSRFQTVPRSSDESSESLALRTSELLRGRLLGGPGTKKSAPSSHHREEAFRRQFSFTSGPSLLLRTFAAPAPGWGGDVAIWFGRWGVGPYLSGALSRSIWNATSDQVSFGLLRVGVGARALVLRSSDQRLQGQVLARLGVEPLSLRGTTGKQGDRFEGSALFFTGEGGIEMSFHMSSWFAMGAQVVGGFDVNMKWPQTQEGRDLPEQAQGNAGNAPAPKPGTQAHLTPSLILAAHF